MIAHLMVAESDGELDPLNYAKSGFPAVWASKANIVHHADCYTN
jgi:hypothetical protein